MRCHVGLQAPLGWKVFQFPIAGYRTRVDMKKHSARTSRFIFASSYLRIKINDKNFEWRFDDSLIIFKF